MRNYNHYDTTNDCRGGSRIIPLQREKKMDFPLFTRARTTFGIAEPCRTRPFGLPLPNCRPTTDPKSCPILRIFHWKFFQYVFWDYESFDNDNEFLHISKWHISLNHDMKNFPNRACFNLFCWHFALKILRLAR